MAERNETVITELRLSRRKLRDAKRSTEISPRHEKLSTVGPERTSTPHLLSFSSACQIVCDGAFTQKSHSQTNATLNLRSLVVVDHFGQLVWGRGGFRVNNIKANQEGEMKRSERDGPLP